MKIDELPMMIELVMTSILSPQTQSEEMRHDDTILGARLDSDPCWHLLSIEGNDSPGAYSYHPGPGGARDREFAREERWELSDQAVMMNSAYMGRGRQ